MSTRRNGGKVYQNTIDFSLRKRKKIYSLAFIFSDTFEASHRKEPWIVMVPKKDLKIGSYPFYVRK